MSRKLTFEVLCLSALFCLIPTLTPALSAQIATEPGVCDDDATRSQFVLDVDSGLSADDLEARYGRCRTNDGTSAVSAGSADGLQSIAAAVKTNLPGGNTFYERINSCGYNPQGEHVDCDVEIRRPFGFGGFPTGTNEYVLYCMSCANNNFFNFTALGSVHVTNDVSGSVPSWYFNAGASTISAPPACTANNGGAAKLRVILQWALPPASCNTIPFWGNRIEFTVRRDP